MQKVELVADGDVISYMFKRTPLGGAYFDLIDSRRTGVTLLALSESRQGAVYGNWGARKLRELDSFLSDFILLESNAEIANVCGALLGRCMQIGRALSWPDAWAQSPAPFPTYVINLETARARKEGGREHFAYWESVGRQDQGRMAAR